MALTKVIGAGAEGLTLSSTSLTVALYDTSHRRNDRPALRLFRERLGWGSAVDTTFHANIESSDSLLSPTDRLSARLPL